MQEAVGFAYALDRVVWFPLRLVAGLFRLATRGPSQSVSVPCSDHAYSGKAICALLRDNGVATWDLQFQPYDYCYRFNVARADAAAAAQVLTQYQIPSDLQPAPSVYQPQPARPQAQTRSAKRWLFG